MADVNDLKTILDILEDEEFGEAAIEVSVSNFYINLKYHEKLRLMTVEGLSFGAGAVMNFMCHS